MKRDIVGRMESNFGLLIEMNNNQEPWIWLELIRDNKHLKLSKKILEREEQPSDEYDEPPKIMLLTKIHQDAGHVEGFIWGSKAVFKSLEYLEIDWTLYNSVKDNLNTDYGWCLTRYQFSYGYRVIHDINQFIACYRLPDRTRPNIEALSREKDDFIKIAEDKEVSYGDGGDLFLFVPLYFKRQLKLPNSFKNRLNDLLSKLGDQRKDWHDDVPVLDIIDPDLGPNYMFESNWQRILELRSKSRNSSYTDILDMFKGPPLRTQYAWIPTDILIQNGREVRTLGPIHNLPIHGNKDLYTCIFRVFQSMLPGFQKLGLISDNEINTRLQVVVKAQKYVIPPYSSYSGNWHVEGKTENIVAAGVYYSKIDAGFEFDKLEYRTLLIPLMTPYDNTIYEYELDIEEGSAVVFANILPHRFLKLTNVTSSPITRQFLSFFIVDPSKPLMSTSYVWDVSKILFKLCPSKVLINQILSFTGAQFNQEEAKELRRLARESMKKELSGWGHLDYGNSGELEFFDPYLVPKNYKNFQYVDIQELDIRGYLTDVMQTLNLEGKKL